MTDASELNTLKRVCTEAATEKRIGDADISKLSAAFGQRFEKALEAVKDRRVKKYVFRPSKRVVWIVVGRERDYLIMPAADFCTCDDFYFRAMDRQIHLCYHLIAQKIAQTTESYELFEEEDELYDVFMREWKNTIV